MYLAIYLCIYLFICLSNHLAILSWSPTEDAHVRWGSRAEAQLTMYTERRPSKSPAENVMEKERTAGSQSPSEDAHVQWGSRAEAQLTMYTEKVAEQKPSRTCHGKGRNCKTMQESEQKDGLHSREDKLKRKWRFTINYLIISVSLSLGLCLIVVEVVVYLCFLLSI